MIEIKSDKTPKLLVIGDLMIDKYLWGSCNRVSQEAPVQIINIDDESTFLGGAGNVVNNLIKLGANVEVISVVGECSNANELKNLLSSIDVSTQYLAVESDRITSKKTRIISSQQQVVRYDHESTAKISLATEEFILSTYMKIMKEFDVILLSDYGKGVLTDTLTKSLISYANKHNKKVLIDPKGKDYSKYKNAYLLTPNKKEASEASGVEINNEESLYMAISQIKSKCKLKVSLITLSEEGVAIYDNKLRIHPTASREVFDVTGAGDTVLAAIGYALACNINIDSAIEFANLAAGVVVGKIGSSTTTLNEIIEYESSLNKSSSDEHIKTFEEIVAICSELKVRGKKIVFTNGCFDLIHTGHIKYLEAAKNYGDILIIGLNSDQSVSTLKGPGRPINSQFDRAFILASLEVVDYVVIFNEDTPYNLINAIMPNTLVKGSDYKPEEVIGHDIVKDLKLIDLVKGKSTSNTIEKIKNGF